MTTRLPRFSHFSRDEGYIRENGRRNAAAQVSLCVVAWNGFSYGENLSTPAAIEVFRGNPQKAANDCSPSCTAVKPPEQSKTPSQHALDGRREFPRTGTTLRQVQIQPGVHTQCMPLHNEESDLPCPCLTRITEGPVGSSTQQASLDQNEIKGHNFNQAA